jgi:hypothetical protein
VAAALAIGVGVVAFETYTAQQHREDERYASRVAWWWVSYQKPVTRLAPAGFGLVVKIQNRSPVPLSDIYFIETPVKDLVNLSRYGSEYQYESLAFTIRQMPLA